MRLYTGTISPTLLDRRLTGCHIEMPKTSALWRHHFIMDSQDEGEALCDTLNANCQQIATAQKVRILSRGVRVGCRGTAEATGRYISRRLIRSGWWTFTPRCAESRSRRGTPWSLSARWRSTRGRRSARTSVRAPQARRL